MLCNCWMVSCVVVGGFRLFKQLLKGLEEWTSGGEDVVLQWGGMLCCRGWESFHNS